MGRTKRYGVRFLTILLVAVILISGRIGYHLRAPELQDFRSLDELREWLDRDTTNQLEYREGICECGDFATTLQRNAELEGFRISLQFLLLGGLPDVMCAAVIERKVYFINPQTDEVSLLGHY